FTDVWNLHVTPIFSGIVASPSTSNNTVTISGEIIPIDLELNPPVSEDEHVIASFVGAPPVSSTAGYQWNVDGVPYMLLNMPGDNGATFTDISGHANHGTLQGATFIPSGCQVGGCMTFDGVDDSVDISGTDFHALSTGTVVGWFFTETGGVLVGASSDSSTNRQFSIAPVATGIRVSAVNEAGVTQFAC